jgi:hypothetical protein
MQPISSKGTRKSLWDTGTKRESCSYIGGNGTTILLAIKQQNIDTEQQTLWDVEHDCFDQITSSSAQNG